MKIFISFIVFYTFSFSDIIYLTIKKENNSFIMHKKIWNDEETELKREISGPACVFETKNICSIPIADFINTKKKLCFTYSKYQVVNKININYMITLNNIKIQKNIREFIQIFKIKAKPDRKKYYWKNYKNYPIEKLSKYEQKKRKWLMRY